MTERPSSETLRTVATAWEALWAPALPGARDGYEFGAGVLLEFERLPGLHRHAEVAVEYAEHVFRALHLLRALSASTPSERVFVSTMSWSEGSIPASRDPWVERYLPAILWHSEPSDARDEPDEDPRFQHTFVTELSVDDPALAAVIPLSVNDGLSFAVFPESASWVYTANEDGAHVRTTPDRAPALVAAFPEWVGRATNVRPTVADDEPSWQIDFSFLRHEDAARVLDAIEVQGLLPHPAFGRLVNPRDTHQVAVDRGDAQALRVLRTGQAEEVVDSWSGERHRMTVMDVRRWFSENGDPLGGLDEFIDEIGYRHPSDAQDGRLDRRFWDPSKHYDGIDGD